MRYSRLSRTRLRSKRRKSRRKSREFLEPVKQWFDASGVLIREVFNLKSAVGRQKYKDRIEEMWTSDEGRCCICWYVAALSEVTFEHTDGRGSMGGGRRNDMAEYTKPNGERVRNGVAHALCNSTKGSRRLA